MKDVLRELSELSLDLQRREMSVPEAHAAVHSKAAYLQALCNLDKPGRSLAKVQNQMENKTFKHVQLSENAAKIHRQQFLQAVVDNLKGRFPDDDLVQMLQPLESTDFPEEEDHKVLYSDEELLKLAKLLSLPVSNAVEEFRIWKRTATVTGHTNLQLQFSGM